MARTQLAAVGAMLANETRAEILSVLMDGRAHTGGELAQICRVTPSTVSEHLSKLLDAQMVEVAAQGRHRYFRLAGPEIAHLLEVVGATPIATDAIPSPKAPAALRYARTCYDHLAGELAVRIYDQLVVAEYLREDDGHVVVTESGAAFLAELGVDVEAAQATKRPTSRPCLDWTERRNHLAGSLATELLNTFIAKKWMARSSTTPRAIRVTEAGRVAIFDYFDLGDARLSA